MTFLWDSIVLVLCLVTFCSSLNPGHRAARSSLYDADFSGGHNLQSWDDYWQAKRDLGDRHWEVDQLQPGTFQNWHEWYTKRGYFGPAGVDNFGLFDKNKFQEWQDWMSKRGRNFKAPFTGFSDLDRGQFQQWNDWISKRFYDLGTAGFGHGPNTLASLQSWEDIAKRQNFVYPSSDLSGSGKADLQNWQDWAKRMGSDKNLFNGYQLGKNARYIKRQLGFSPERYGSFGRYFTDGLQNWMLTTKRDKSKNQQKSEQH